MIIYIELYYSNNHTHHFLALAAFFGAAFFGAAFFTTFFGAAFFGAAFLATFFEAFLAAGAVSEKEYQLAKRP